MPAIDIDTTPTNMAPSLTQLVTCPFCRAGVGVPCTTRNATLSPRAHVARWKASSDSARRDLALFQATQDCPDHWVNGDYLIAKAYSLDPQKVTVLRVCRTGEDPSRNAYRSEVTVVRVLFSEETRRLGLSA